MPSLNLDFRFFDHPKVKRLVGLLGKGAETLPLRLWCHCGEYHSDDGRLTGYSTQEIETISGWWGTSGAAIEALVRVGFLDVVDGGYQIHHWLEREGHLIAYRKRAKAAAKKRWAKNTDASSNASSNANEVSKHCLTTALHCTDFSSSEGIKGVGGGERETPARAVEKTPEFLATEWCFYFHGTASTERDLSRLTPFFSAWLDAGGDFANILAAIRSKKRDTTEPTWTFQKRLNGHASKDLFSGLKEFVVRGQDGPQ